MTSPTTPDGAITRAARRLSAARDATRALSQDIQERRAAATVDQAATPDVQPGQS